MGRLSRTFLVVVAFLAGGLAGGALVRLAFPASDVGPRTLYLDLMKRAVTDLLYEQHPQAIAARKDGRDWPGRAHTMIGLARLENLQVLMEDLLRRDVPGDFIECGAWRGGATIFMRAVLKAHGVTDRTVWVADSFEGLPPPEPEKYPADIGVTGHTFQYLAVPLEKVQDNFSRYGLLDDRVRFLKGWFRDTMPRSGIERLALLRVDADMYEGTTDVLENLYGKVSPGGYVIVDDVGALDACKKAVEDFRRKHGITSEVKPIDWTGIYWQKEK